MGLNTIQHASPFVLADEDGDNDRNGIDESCQEQARRGEAVTFPIVGSRPLLSPLPEEFPDEPLEIPDGG